MPTFYIENSASGRKERRMAVVYAKNENEATQRLLERFPDAVGFKFIRESRLINPSLSTTIIKEKAK